MQPSDDYVGTKGFFVPQLVWQPRTLEEFHNMVEARSTNNLDLCPNMASYENTVRRTYYNGEDIDNSIENIITILQNCEPGSGAELDLESLAALQAFSPRERALLWIGRSVSSRLARRLALTYMRIKKRLTPDSYLAHHVYLPD